MKKTRHILLFGGGKETVYNLHHIKKGDEVLLLHFKYGQKSYTREGISLRYYAKKFGYQYDTIDLTGIIGIPYAIKTGEATTEGSNVAMRNTIFISIAVNYAVQHSYTNIIIGTVKSDKPYTNDGHQHYLADMTRIVKHTEKITLNSPTNKKTWDQICKFLVSGRADISHLWFCENSYKTPCRTCNKCKKFEHEATTLGYEYPLELFNKITYENK